MRNVGIALVSILLTTVVIGNAFYQKKQFYPSVVYITKSNPSMAVIYIQAFILVILTGKLMRKVFFGELRPVELEHLMERSWYAVTETCLAFTVFRDDFSPKFVALFTLLLFLKSFHWLADERVDFMERSPVISWLFHVRIISLLIMLGALDITFVSHAYQSTLNRGASVQLVFGFEYAILLTIILNIVIKYAFHVNDIHDLPMENKAVFLLYTELVMGFIKVMLYLSFVFIMVRIYTLPLFAFRPMYFTVKAFKKAINDVIMSRRAIRNMNTLYPDATPEELEAADNVCIICREEMHSASKKLPCNHIFHTSCLRSWFQRQQTCPTCRLNILRTPNAQTPPAQPQDARQEPQIHVPPLQGNFQWMPNPNPNVAHGNNNNDRVRPPGGPTGTAPPQQPGPIPDNIPLICPPFPFIAFNTPPPMPPTETLTDEELRRMELQTREGTEARIRCLQNIRCLLDASVTMMQQYCAVVAASQIHQTVYETSEPSTSGSGAAGTSSGTANDDTQPSSSKNTVGMPTPSNEASQQENVPEGTSGDDSIGVKDDAKSQDAFEVLRQRRLEKFSKELNHSSDTSA